MVSARSEGREGLDGNKATWVQLRFLGLRERTFGRQGGLAGKYRGGDAFNVKRERLFKLGDGTMGDEDVWPSKTNVVFMTALQVVLCSLG